MQADEKRRALVGFEATYAERGELLSDMRRGVVERERECLRATEAIAAQEE